MIRFRIGQSWKRDEPGREPTDAFAFELEGVNLFPGANDEPLVRVVSGLVEAVAAMVVDGDRAGQLSLEDVQLEACFWRKAGLAVEVAIIELGVEPRRLRPPVTVELPALVEATLSVARTFLRDSTAHRQTHAEALVALERRVKVLGSTVIRELSAAIEPRWQAERTARLGYVVDDAEGRSGSFHRRARAGLPSLLISGRVGAGDQAIDGLPFLTLMGLARAAAGGPVKVGSAKVSPDEIFGAGLDLCLALRAHNPGQASNPWLEALQVRCADGLRALRKPVPDVSGATATISAPRPSVASSTPLASTGQVRRVALTLAWSRPVALGEEGGRLRLGRGGLVAQSPHAAHAFSTKGAERFRRLSPNGVAANLEGSLTASAARVLYFSDTGASATWLRDHDGAALGPGLESLGELVLTSLARRGVVAFDRLTGRERWRFDPPRTQRSFSSLIGSRVLVATDSGTLYGVDLSSGQLVFTVRSQVPCAAAAVALGKRAVVVLNRGDHTPIYACDALASGERAAGAVAWTRELTLAAPRPAAVTRNRIFLAGARDGRSTVIALSGSGQVLWERAAHLDAATVTLLPFKGGVIAGDARGTAVRLLPDGQTAWVLGGEGDQLGSAIALALSRAVLVVPGPRIKVVDPVTGRELFALPPAPRVNDVAVDARLNLYVLKEPGLLEAWKPATVLSVV